METDYFRRGSGGAAGAPPSTLDAFSPVSSLIGGRMNNIIYIVGLVVIVLAVLGYFGLR